MSKNKEGFSLVELIGVIILISLAIIIVVPNVLKIMEKNEKSTFEESVKGLIRAVQDHYSSTLDNFPAEGLKISDIDFEIEHAEKFTNGVIVDTEGTLFAVNVSNGKYCATGKRNSLEIDKVCSTTMGLVDYVNLNNFSNWRTGQYSLTTGLYELYGARLALNDYVVASPKTNYQIKINKPGYHVLIRELDKNKNFLMSHDLDNDMNFISNKNVKYFGVSIYYNPDDSINTYATYETLFSENIELSIKKLDIQHYDTIPDLNNFSNWRTGNYSNIDAQYVPIANRLCLNSYVVIFPNTTYKANISGNLNYYLVVRELTEDGTLIKSEILSNNATITTTNDTRYLAIILYNGIEGEAGITYETYKTLFESGYTVSLTQQ